MNKKDIFRMKFMWKMSFYIGCIIFSVGERKNSLPTLNFFAKNILYIKYLNAFNIQKYDII